MLLLDLRIDLGSGKILVAKQVRNVGKRRAGHAQVRRE
jgi:hypothetical protein